MSAKRVARQPRHWAARPDEFGTTPSPEWVAAADTFERVCLRAAQIQHEVLVVADAHRRQHGDLSWKEWADEFEMSYAQLLKVIRGQAHMSLRHVADFTRVLGPVLMTEFARVTGRARSTEPEPAHLVRGPDRRCPAGG